MENQSNVYTFLRGGGEMGALIRNHDWAATPIGPIENWPISLRNAVAMLLASKFPMFLYWGEHHIQFYNDDYRKTLGFDGKHPSALGQKAKECWPEVWDTIQPLIDKVMTEGDGVWFEDMKLPRFRDGEFRDSYWTFSYSAVNGDSGEIEGVLVVCTETTEKITTIKNLEDSKNQLEFAIDATELGTWDLNPETGRFKGNSRLKAWFGLQPEEEIPLSAATDVIVEKDRRRVKEAIEFAMNYESGGHYDVEYIILNPITNKKIIVRAKGRAWFNDDKECYRFNGTLQDITVRRLAQKEIDNANHMADLAIKSAGLGLFQVDLRSGRMEYNPTFAGILTGNRNNKDLHRKSFIDRIHPDDMAARAAALESGKANNEFIYSPRTIWDDGSVHRIVVMGANTFDSAGNAVMFSGTVRDVTLQENQRIALVQSEERFRSMVEEAPVATCLFTGKDMVIDVANDIMISYWGKTKKVIGKPLAQAVPELIGQPFLDILDRIYETGITHEEKAAPAMLNLDGTLRTYYFDYTYKPLFDAEGKVYAIMDMAIDVTDQILSQQKIEESQRQLLASFVDSPVGIATIIEEGLTFTMANPFYGELVGRKPEDIVGKPLLEALPELAGQGFDNILRNVIATGNAYIANEVEVTLLRNNILEAIYVNLTYQPRYDLNGTFLNILVVATDVTQQVRSRKSVEASEARLKSIIATAPAGMGLFVGRDLIVELPNQTFIDIVGKGWDIVGKPLREAMPELLTEGQPFLKILDDVFTTGVMFQSYGSQVKIVQNGVMTYNYYNITYTPLFDENNEVYAILDIAIDVTEAVTARQNLENTQASLRSAIELAQLANWRYNIKDNTFTYSERFMDWLGFAEATKDIDSAYNPLPAEYRNVVPNAIVAAIKSESGVYDNEHPIVNRTTGQVRIVHAVAQVFYDSEGKPEFLTGVAQDVTEERTLQQELEFQVAERTEELQATNEELADANNALMQNNKELEQFAYIASHDLQEPARKISIFANMLSESLNSIDERSQSYLNKINKSADRMITLVRDVLGYSQLSKEHQVFTPVNLTKITNDIISDFELILEQSHAQVIYDNLPVIDAIPLQMSQLFGNLISNALKYNKPGVPPVITITSKALTTAEAIETFGPKATGHYYKIDFKDNGIGFDQKYADKIFNIFQRLHSKSEYTGTGIGLALCKKIMQNHYGDIQAHSVENEGSTFTVILPERHVNAYH
ncbi:PAS domain S-box protein [Flavobacterium zepuense]|uniref:histidine kinase n=1 Tax=Flavobacterium zepuense TaxID=2593302 RepID=A0A552V5M2_9FLAO|nr:PAS domain S-box protein [Flavobacterium zepuense]TRW25774.1 PAS domain S-box protein [Flavobacterium zepuense]